MADYIKIDPRRLLGVRITVNQNAPYPRCEAVTTAKTGAKVGAKPRKA